MLSLYHWVRLYCDFSIRRTIRQKNLVFAPTPKLSLKLVIASALFLYDQNPCSWETNKPTWNIKLKQRFPRALWEQWGHFLSSHQSVEKVWLKVYIAFIFLLIMLIIWMTKYWHFWFWVLACCKTTNSIHFLVPSYSRATILCRCEQHLRNDGNHYTSASGHGGSYCIKVFWGLGVLLLTNSLNIKMDFHSLNEKSNQVCVLRGTRGQGMKCRVFQSLKLLLFKLYIHKFYSMVTQRKCSKIYFRIFITKH